MAALPIPIPLSVWMNMPTFHQADLLRALAAVEGVDLRVHFARRLSADRAALGWQADAVDLGFAADYLDGSIRRALTTAQAERQRIHIVGGVWAERTFTAALAYLRISGSKCLIYAEAGDPLVQRSSAKQLLQTVFGRWISSGNHIALLPVAKQAARFYQTLGFKRLYPFGYFQQPSQPAELERSGANIVFVGQLIERKGVDLLVEALLPLFEEFPDLDLTLTIIGDGPLRGSLQEQSAPYAARVRFEGVLPSTEIPARLAKMDVLVLPSRFDGWGMVVNEALMVGTPVIVSDQCGASDLVTQGRNGWIFRAGDVQDLGHSLRNFLTQTAEQKRQMRHSAAAIREHLSATTAAHYLTDCLRHLAGQRSTQPVLPWTVVSSPTEAEGLR